MKKISFIGLLFLAFTVSNIFGQVAGTQRNRGDLPKAKSITLVSPNGGETWKIGSTHSIRWVSQEVQFVRIDLSTTGGTSWKTIITSTTASVGQYDWTISANNYSSTQQAQIRVYDISDGAIIDQSNSNFTISQLDITAPTSAIKMQAGDNYDIKWTSSSDINNVSIEYTTNGLIWNQISASVSANSSPYTWNVPDEPTATAQIRITDLNNSVNTVNSDTFSIASLALTSPTGGEDWFSGTNQAVSWTSTNVSFLKIEYSTDNGLTWSTISNSESAGSGNYSWRLPFTPTNEAQLRISDASFPNVKSQTSNKFTISSIRVDSPNGSEGWTIGSSKTISWTSNIVGNVKIELSTDNGSTFSNVLVNSVAASASSSNITVPNTPTTNAIVKISSENDPTKFDISDQAFTIGDVSITSPAGGEVWQASTVHQITWNSNGLAVVAIDYSTDGTTWNAITSAVSASGGSYDWSIPSSLSGSNITLRIKDAIVGTSISDISNPFSVTSLKLTSPLGGEAWKSGSTHNITWNAAASINNIKIEYSTDNGSNWTTMAVNVNAAAGTYSWNIPGALSSAQMYVRIINEDNSNITSNNSAAFRIGSVALTTPNGGETLLANGTYNITWASTSSINFVRLQYSTNGGSSFINIANIVNASLGTYSWSVPNVTSTNAKIRISDTFGPTIDDTSSSTFTIAKLQVLSPNGAEGYSPGSSQTITWSSQSINNVKLEFSADGGSSWSTLIGSVNAALGSYNWTVPTSTTSQGRIRISSSDNPSFYDISDADFKIASLVVGAPNGGENYQTGSSQTISWSASSNITSVNIDLSTDNGSNWISLSSNYDATQNYSWTIGNTPSSQALLRVTDAGNSNIKDESDANFSIERLQIVSPNGGDFFLVDSLVNITWNSNSVTNVKLEYTTNSGLVWQSIISSTPAAPQVYSWKIPNAPSLTTLIRITDADNPAAGISDKSDTTFTISSLYLKSPNGGESFSVNSQQTIKWNAHSSVNTVTLEYTTNNGSSWNTISNSVTASDQSYPWTIPNGVTNQALVRITDNANTNVTDVSDNLFSIGSMSVTAPNGGERWKVGSTHQITWNNINSVLQVNIEFSTDNGTSWTTIASNLTASLETYDWTLPNALSSQVLVRVSDAATSSINDVSDAVFTIADLAVTAPNGNEAINVGTPYTITWTSSNIPQIDIEYSSNNGTSWITIANGVSASVGNYQWTTPTTSTSTGLIKITDSQVSAISDASDLNFSLISLDLTSPNGGEGWQIGDTKSITWTHGGVSSVKLEYSTDNGTSWNLIINNITANDLSYNWTVPNSASAQYLIRITDEARSVITDQSAAVFTVGSITVSKPAGTDNWKSGTTNEITWTATDGLNTVNLDYSTDNGGNWSSIATSVPASSQSYFWTIPGNISSSNALVRVSHGISGSEIKDESSVFTINSLQLTKPNGGDYFQAGSTEKIEWTSSVVNSLNIEYSTNGGSSWSVIATNYPAATAFYNWNVPAGISSKQAKIRIKDANNTSILDSSDAIFTIGTVTISSPATDSVWQANKAFTIKWSASSSVDLVRLDYSTDLGSSWNVITTSVTASLGVYQWTIPANISSNSVVLRASDSQSSLAISDNSDVFTISYLEVTAPNGGENWQAGSSQTITWNSGSTISNVNLYYSADGGTSWNSIANGLTASDGSYNWTLPSSQASANMLVKIENSANANINDASDAVFTSSNLSLTLPNSSSVLKAGNDFLITWSQNNITNIKLEYSLDNQTTWSTIVGSAAASLNQYTWSVPSSVSTNQGVIRISDVSDAGIKDTAGLFIIKQLDLTAPNGGESWQSGSQQNITWTSGQVSQVNLFYSTNSGTSWTSITSGVNAAGGSYSWSIPSNVTSSQAMVKIEDASNSSITDSSASVFSIGDINITAPTAGVEWQSGATETITWTSTDVNNIKLEYTTDNGASWNSIVASVAASLQSYDWSIPSGISSNQAKIRASSVSGISLVSVGDLFTIKQLDLTKPNGGEIAQAGSNYSITWNSGQVGTIDIYYSANNGQIWNSIAAGVNAAAGTYSWAVPSDVTSSNAIVRLIDAGNSSVRDSSSAVFTIGKLKITRPALGNEWQAGRTYDIYWSQSGVQNMKIELSTNNGTNWTVVSASTSAGRGGYSWLIPSSISSSQALLRVSSVEDNSITAQSDLFTIKKLSLSSPNGGELYQSGSTQNITWSAGQVSSIDISYSTNNGSSWNAISSGVNGSLGTFSWSIPSNVTSSQALVRIIDANNSSIRDSSSAVFSIGSLSLTSPAGGEVWQSNTANNITWSASGIDNIKIEYSVDNGSNWSIISSSVNASNGTYSWSIPLGVSSNLALVRINAVSDQTISSASNNFTIKQLDLTSPNGGEYYLSGTSTSITWNAGQVNTVSLYYSLDNGSTFKVIAENRNASTGTYTWNIPDTLTSSQTIVRIVDVDNTTVRDQSDNLFTIGLLSVTTPAGGEEWQTGSTQKLRWQSSNSGNLKIEYSLDGSSWTSIATGIDPTTGFYDWTIPTGISSSSAQIRLTSESSSSIQDVSPAFSLKELNLTSPDGGENWLAGSAKQITWSSGAITGIDIYLSKNNGQSWNLIKANQNAAAGSYSWNIPDTISTNSALIRLQDAANSSIKDSSNNVFTINTLVLTAPAGGERYSEGSDVTVKWTGSSTFSQVKLEYSIDGGINWSSIVSSAPAADGSYTWTIPSGTATDKARIRVSDLPNGNFVSGSADFTIAKLQLSSPNGGDYLQAGSSQNITWQSSFVNNVDIDYSSDGGSNWTSIVANNPAAGQSYSWNIPANLSSTQMLVRIIDGQSSTITDVSASQFTVGSIIVVAPNNGELLNAGNTTTIQWTNSSSVSNVKIELSTDNGSTWNSIVDNTPADGSYDWAISSAITSDKCLIRISDALSNLGISDVSDNVFVIDALILSSPNGGESFQIGSTQAITWQSVSSINNVKLEYKEDGGAWNLIANNVAANLGTYNWTVPNAPSDSVFMRVSDPNNNSFSDVSSSAFRISDVKLTQPNGGEKWQASTKHKINWTRSVNVDSVDLFYSTGGNWQFISRRAGADGSYNWTLPNTTSSNYSVQVVDKRSSSNVTDTSDARFIVSDINLLQPVGGETLLAGSTEIIRWNNSSDVDSLEISYSVNAGTTWNQIALLKGTTTQYSWTIPQGISSSSVLLSIRDLNFADIGDTTTTFTISTSSLVLTQPNGGEFIPTGSSYSIKWTADASIQNIGIDLSTDNGATWNTLASNVSANLRQYIWNVSSSLSSSQALIKVYDVINTFISDVSNTTFTVGGLTLIAPNGGEHWQSGSTQTIQWSSSTNVANIKIEYSTDSGTSWQTIQSNYPAAGGSYSWSIPNVSASSALVRLSDVIAGSEISDTSASGFIISQLTLTSPNGGEDLQLGSSFDISWVNSSDITQVTIEYSTDGINWQNITSQPVDASTGKYTWNLTSLNCSATNFIRVKDFTFSSTTDINDANFTIKQLDISSPGGGENWQAGSTQSIAWDFCSVNNVILEYSLNGGTSWIKMDTVAASALNYNWTVVNDTSSNAKIRLRDAANAAVISVSNSFTIFTPSLSLSSPNGGEHYQAKDVRQIKWSSIWLNTIKIEYSLDNGANWTILENSYPAVSGSYNWLLPDTVSSLALVKISDPQNASLVDSSANTFKISKLSIVSPLGGEFWVSGSSQQIKWSASNTINNVKLSYTLDGQTWNVVPGGGALSASTGSFTWNVGANVSSSAAKVLVEAVGGDSIDAVSPAAFKIGWIKATKPSGGEIFNAGKSIQISLEKSTSITNLKIDLLDQSTGLKPKSVTIGDTTSYKFTLPADVTTDSARIIVSDEGSNYKIADTSQIFSIRTLRLTSPISSTNWMAGTNQQITWNASAQIDSVKIEFTTDAGSTWNPVTSNPLAASTGSYTWSISSTISSSKSMIRINDIANPAIADTTAQFTIYIPSLTLTSPNGGDFLISGNTVKIKWDAGFVTSIKIEFSTNSGANWQTLVSPYNASNGFYNWTIPASMSTSEGLIKVTDFSDPTNTDVSDAIFKIGWIKLTTPSQGDRYRSGLSANIAWQTSSSVDLIDLYYTTGTDTIPIATNQLSANGSYNWSNLPSLSTDAMTIIAFDSESKRKLFSSAGPFSIAILNLDTPNGGEFLSSGITTKIKWTSSTNISRLKIRLYTPESGWEVVTPTTVNSSGSYDWSIASTKVSDSARIEISDVQYPNVADTSDAIFRIGNLQLLSLKNSEKIRENSIYKLQWSASANIKFVELAYKIAKGNSWTPIVITKADSTYDWKVPQTPSDVCFIRVRDVNNTSLQDTNSSPFTIARLRITSPIGGEYMQAGVNRDYTITLERQFVDNIRLEFTKDYTASPIKWENIQIPTGTATSYVWNEIESFGLSDAGSNYRIRVYDLNYTDVGDTVDKAIIVSYLRMVSPNGGGGEQIGTQYKVEWIASSNTISTVNLAVKGSGDPNYGVPLNINPITSSDLNYLWDINIDPNPAVSMKVYDPEHPEIYDESDSTFIISRIQLVTPDGGERWQIGKTYGIEWKSDYIDEVILQYNLTGNDADWQNIQSAGFQNSSSGGGKYNWTLSDGLVFSSDKAKVRVVSSKFSNIRDTSKTNFTIVRLEVTSPQSREAWSTGTSHKITWTSEKLDSVRILVDPGNGNAAIPIAGPISSVSDNPYNWTVPVGITTSKARIIVRDYRDASLSDTGKVQFVIGPSPVVRVRDEYQGGNIKITWNFDTPGEKVQITGLDWRKSGNTFYSPGGSGLTLTANEFTGPVTEDTIKWNSKQFVDSFEGFVDIKVLYLSDFNVTYEVAVDSIKIDNKAPIYDDATFKTTQNIFNNGWDKVLVHWKAAIDSSKPVTVSFISDSASINGVKTNRDSMILRDLTTASKYSFSIKVSDALGNSKTYQHSFNTLNLADYNGDKSIDVVDLASFTASWSSPDSIYGADFYPYSGNIPFVKPTGNMELDISDLLTFIDVWYYDKINISLPKIAGNDEAADERRSIRFKKGDKKFEFPINIQSDKTAKAYSVKLFYDYSKFDIDSVSITGNSVEESDLSLIYVDSANGIIYADYAKLKGSVNGNYVLSASVSSNLDKFNPSDSLRMNVMAVNSKSETIFKKSIVYSVTEIPRSYSLSQNYPNPFNPTTTIEYELPEPAKVKLVLYNILGQKIAVMVNNIQKEGAYRYTLDASRINGGLASGVYIYRFVANKFTKTKKLLLLK